MLKPRGANAAGPGNGGLGIEDPPSLPGSTPIFDVLEKSLQCLFQTKNIFTNFFTLT